MALASNRSLAEQNLDMKPHLESQKEELVEKYSQLEAIRETYRRHCSDRGQLEPVVCRFGPGSASTRRGQPILLDCSGTEQIFSTNVFPER